MRHCGKKVITEGGQIESFPVKQLMREEDADKGESDCITNEFEDEAKLVDKIAIVSVMKNN